MYKHMMDCHLIQPYHFTSICFTNQSDIFPEKLLARQSRADSWRQHIKGLCGSAVSINGLSRSFLPSGCSTQGYIITIELSATRVRLLKEMELVPNKDITVTHNIKDGLFQSHVILAGLCCLQRGKFALCVCSSFGILFICFVVSLDSYQWPSVWLHAANRVLCHCCVWYRVCVYEINKSIHGSAY